jgi:hypothetical protein
MPDTLKETETYRLIDEDAADANADLVAKIKAAKSSGSEMTADEFKAWLDRQ